MTQYPNFLIRQTRLEKNWSQQGLCKDICSVSYLSKIEQGKVTPSEEITKQLLQRMGIVWHTLPAAVLNETLHQAYELLFSYNLTALKATLQTEPWQQCKYSCLQLDYQLLTCYASDYNTPLATALEVCMNPVQLALQRNLQGQQEEAIRLYPCSFLYMKAGITQCAKGNNVHAMELLQLANSLASQEGRARIMLLTRLTIGTCYSNLRDFENMNKQYNAAKRLARDTGCSDYLDTINYNIAATQVELGQYEAALAYLVNAANPTQSILHKLAICYEKLCQPQKALAVLEQAANLPSTLPEQLDSKMCNVVKLRLLNPDYLDSELYGNALLQCFALCKKHMPIGYCSFHLPWVLEWYEHHRQYKQAYQLALDFPV